MLDFKTADKGEWRGKLEDTSLFTFWQNLEKENVSYSTEADYDVIEFNEEVVKNDEENNVEFIINIDGPTKTPKDKEPIVVTVDSNICDYQPVDDIILVEDEIEDPLPEFDFSISNFNISADDIDISLLQNPLSIEEIHFLENQESNDNYDVNKLEKIHKAPEIKNTEKEEIKKDDKQEKQDKDSEEERNNNKENIDANENVASNDIECAYVTPQKSLSKTSSNLPTPFKKQLFWEPSIDDKKSKTRTPKEKIPAVVTSEIWQSSKKTKNTKKQKKLKKKKIENKKESKNKRKRQKRSS